MNNARKGKCQSKTEKLLAFSAAGNVLLVFGFILALRAAFRRERQYVSSLERIVE